MDVSSSEISEGLIRFGPERQERNDQNSWKGFGSLGMVPCQAQRAGVQLAK